MRDRRTEGLLPSTLPLPPPPPLWPADSDSAADTTELPPAERCPTRKLPSRLTGGGGATAPASVGSAEVALSGALMASTCSALVIASTPALALLALAEAAAAALPAVPLLRTLGAAKVASPLTEQLPRGVVIRRPKLLSRGSVPLLHRRPSSRGVAAALAEVDSCALLWPAELEPAAEATEMPQLEPAASAAVPSERPLLPPLDSSRVGKLSPRQRPPSDVERTAAAAAACDTESARDAASRCSAGGGAITKSSPAEAPAAAAAVPIPMPIPS